MSLRHRIHDNRIADLLLLIVALSLWIALRLWVVDLLLLIVALRLWVVDLLLVVALGLWIVDLFLLIVALGLWVVYLLLRDRCGFAHARGHDIGPRPAPPPVVRPAAAVTSAGLDLERGPFSQTRQGDRRRVAVGILIAPQNLIGEPVGQKRQNRPRPT